MTLDDVRGGIVAIGLLSERVPDGEERRVLQEMATIAKRPHRYWSVSSGDDEIDEYDALLARLRAVQRDRRILDAVVSHAILHTAFEELGARASSKRRSAMSRQDALAWLFAHRVLHTAFEELSAAADSARRAA